MSGKINIEGMDKAEVFAALYNGARPQGLGFLHYDATPLTANEARNKYGVEGYHDYVSGRVMKVDLRGNEFDSWGYNRDNGDNAAEKIVNALRKTNDVNPEEAELIHKEGTRAAAIILNEHLTDQSVSEEEGGLLTMNLGPAQFAEELKPKIDDILAD